MAEGLPTRWMGMPQSRCCFTKRVGSRSIGRDLVFDLAERRPGQHPLGDEFVNAGVGTARNDRSPEAPTQAVQVLNRSGVDVHPCWTTGSCGGAFHTLGVRRIRSDRSGL